MNNNEFEQFIQESGKDLLRFCRMTAGDDEDGNELYQDMMLKLMEKMKKLDAAQNLKSYAVSVSVFLWRNKKKKYSIRSRIAKIGSLEEYAENGVQLGISDYQESPEHMLIQRSETEMVRMLVSQLPEKYRMPLYLNYSANMKLEEIADYLQIPVNTVKTRIRKAKSLLKNQLEDMGYDR